MKIKFKNKMHAGTTRVYPNDEVSEILLEILRLGANARQSFSDKVMQKIHLLAQKLNLEIEIEE